MKILSVHNLYQRPGGEDVVCRNEAALLRSKGHSVREFFRSNSGISSFDPLASAQVAMRTIWSRESSRDLRRMIAHERPQIVHFHNTFPLISPSAYYACREFGVPVVQTLHNYRLVCPAATLFRRGRICEECVEHSLWRSIRYACYRGSRPATATTAAMLAVHRALSTWRDCVDRFIVPAEFCRDKFSRTGISHQKISVKPHFLSADPGRGTRPGYGAIFVGRLAAEKGVATLVAAWKRLSSRSTLRIFGDGPLRIELERAAAGFENISFEGWATRDRVLDAIKSSQFLALPSEWYEMFGLVAIEAFACGVPVIASRLGVMLDRVDHGRTGLHFAPGDAGDLASTMQWALEHPREIKEMGRNARSEYEAKYTADENYRQLMEIYEGAISARAAVAVAPFHSDSGGQDAVQSSPEARLS